MGAAQSAGGAATSGASISGTELSYAIREAAKRDAVAASELNLDDAPTAQQLDAVTEFSFDYGLGEEQRQMKVTSFAPTVFARIRKVEGATDEHFLAEWTLPEERCKTALGEGRSMAMFMKSLNMDFMCKTIAAAEVDVLQGILNAYVQHLQKNHDSLLMRFLMLLKIEANNDVGFLLVFADSFASAEKLNERWDVKGRIPKPGKFRHFPPRDPETLMAEAQALEASTHQVHDGTSSRFSDTAQHPPRSPLSRSIPTRKDKELTRLFWLESDIRDRLMHDLQSDFDFLCSNGLMDYSILVGVSYTADGTALPHLRQDTHLSPSTTTPSSHFPDSAPAAEVRPPRAQQNDNALISRYHSGVRSMLGEETYYIAIIDMLTLYNAKKMSANFFKGFLWRPSTLSTIPPEPYRERVSSYASLIFASPDDDLNDVTQMHERAD